MKAYLIPCKTGALRPASIAATASIAKPGFETPTKTIALHAWYQDLT